MYPLFCRFTQILLLLLVVICTACKEKSNQYSYNHDKSARHIRKQDENKHVKEQDNKPFDKYHAKAKKQGFGRSGASGQNQRELIPQKVQDVLAYVLKERQPPKGYVGGRRFGNFEGHLPRKNPEGGRINYQEWDVNPKEKGRNRGVERLITNSAGRAWYTKDHYNSFIEIK
ncbi:MAG: ribonuclease [Rudanella sp.]|nr:ribonuclease [Rudanella sp.]